MIAKFIGQATILILQLCMIVSCSLDPPSESYAKFKSNDDNFVVWFLDRNDSIYISYMAILKNGSIINAGIDSSDFAGVFSKKGKKVFEVELLDYRRDIWLQPANYMFKVKLRLQGDSLYWNLLNDESSNVRPYVPISSALVKENSKSKSFMNPNIEGHTIADTLKYLQVGNPDTALAIFAFKYCESPNFEIQKEEYIRIDLEYHQLLDLVSSLFQNHPSIDQKLMLIEHNRDLFVDYMRSRVIADYNKFNGVSGMYLDFLVSRKDSLVRPILVDLLANPKTSQVEKEYAKEVLDSISD